MKPLALLAIALFLCGCIPFNYNGTARIYRDHSNIKHNILITGQPQGRFQSIWGPPTRTYSRRFDTGQHGQYAWTPFGGGGSFSARSGETYDLWFYKERGVTLVFNHENLVYWHWGTDAPEESRVFETDKIQ
jgi:hypothetical protein